MKKLFWAAILIALMMFWLSVYLAYAACNPETLKTVDYGLMGIASIMGVTSIFTAFAAFLGLEHLNLYQ